MGDGYYFDGDYPEVYDEEIKDLQSFLVFQLSELEKNDRTEDASTIGFLRGRRTSRPSLVQIEITHLNPPRVLVASGQVILDAAELSKPGVTRKIRKAGFCRADGGSGRFVRLVNDFTGQSEIAEEIADQGHPNTLALTASVGKGVGGPDPVANPLPEGEKNFRDYHLPDAEPTSDEGPIVAIIDTGIPGNKKDDPLPTMIRTDGWLDDVPRTGTNRDQLDYLPHPDGYLDYQAGHGSFVAGVVQRVAPTARIRMYQAADTDGFADDAAVADAIRQAVAGGAEIINLSLGMVTSNDVPPPELEAVIEEVVRKGVVVVAAAGNFGNETTCWPAAFADVVAVGALIETEEVGNGASTQRTGRFEAAPWSSKGGYIDLWTVAEGVRSTFVTGRESPVFDHNHPAVFPENAWALWSGTSFAAPQIAGAIARIQQERGLTPRAAVDFLRDQGAQVKDHDGNFKSGRGLRILSGIPIPPAERPIPPADNAS